MRFYYNLFILATFVVIVAIPFMSTAAPFVKLSTLLTTNNNDMNLQTGPGNLSLNQSLTVQKKFEGTNSCIDACKFEPPIKKTTDPSQKECIAACAGTIEYQNFDCAQCKKNCDGLAKGVDTACRIDCDKYLMNCRNPDEDCSACLWKCIGDKTVDNNNKECFYMCTVPPDNACNRAFTCYQCMMAQPAFSFSSDEINKSWKTNCDEAFGCFPPNADCDKCLSLCREYSNDYSDIATDLQQNCVYKCGETASCKKQNEESCGKCILNCQGLLPSVSSYCMEKCKTSKNKCELPDISKCDECWNSCKSFTDKLPQSHCVDECQGIKECGYSDCNECQERAKGLLPELYDIWVEECRDIYKSNCPSQGGSECDQCWADCFVKYAQSKDVNLLDNCIGKCQNKTRCSDSSCGECIMRAENAGSEGKVPSGWVNTMKLKCISSDPDCSEPGSDCFKCGENCNNKPDCMANKCPKCVPEWSEKCINCEKFCSKLQSPTSCIELCEGKNKKNNCQISDCAHCKDACSHISDPKQRSWCNVLCLINKQNNCNPGCKECWDNCPPIPLQAMPDDFSCQMACSNTICSGGPGNGMTCSDCQALCKSHTALSYDNCIHNVCEKDYCDKTASFQVSQSLIPITPNNTPKVQPFSPVNLVQTSTYNPAGTWVISTRTPAPFFPVTRLYLTQTTGWGIITRTGDASAPPLPTFTPGPLFFGNVSISNNTLNISKKTPA